MEFDGIYSVRRCWSATGSPYTMNLRARFVAKGSQLRNPRCFDRDERITDLVRRKIQQTGGQRRWSSA
ncbi:unnamed protein product [Mycena citricolor]|uniref:Uncharacterized protein n=1 Tax=Mycena citricolor TaxID=2018698 RepID=A0AAD2H0H7_9AGAR|nr:unnamed protein product [Mycena citricolor]